MRCRGIRGHPAIKNDSRRDPEQRKAFRYASGSKAKTAFLELESAIRPTSGELQFLTKPLLATQFAPQGSQAEQSATEQRNCRAAIRNTYSSRINADVV